MTKKVSIDNATVDTDEFRQYNSRAQQILQDKSDCDEDYKALVEEVSAATKLKKPVVSAYFKARFNFKSQEAVKKGELFSTLDTVLDA